MATATNAIYSITSELNHPDCTANSPSTRPAITLSGVGDDVLLEVTQIGKECHDKCAIYYQVGECIMPKNGIFTRVLKGGKVKVGDKCELVDTGKKILSL